MKKIFILSMWRSGTSWLQDILGKNVEKSSLFGNEQQILPLLSMYKKAFHDSSVKVRQNANIPLCDIQKQDFHKELGLKQHKVLLNARKYSNEDFNSFALRLMEFYLYPYTQKQYLQVVEKSPENLSPESFQIAIDVFKNKNEYSLVYLLRDYKQYLASCYLKFIVKDINDLEYYSKKWIEWNSSALKYIKDKNISNLYLLRYKDLVENSSVVEKFCVVRKKDIEIRQKTLSKWEESPSIDKINKLYSQNKEEITKIINKFKENKFLLTKSYKSDKIPSVEV